MVIADETSRGQEVAAPYLYLHENFSMATVADIAPAQRLRTDFVSELRYNGSASTSPWDGG